MKKNLPLKRILIISLFSFALLSIGYGQKTVPFYDGINYSAGTLVYDAANWWVLNSTPVNDVTVSSGSLTYPGLRESAGNKISISGAGDDFVIWFDDRPADSKVYYSLVFQVTSLSGISAASPTYFAGFFNSATTSGSFGCGLYVQLDANDVTKFNIGHWARSSSSTTPVWNTIDGTTNGTPVQYSINIPIFIVACYEIVGTYLSGSPDDKSSMWINPSSSTFENLLPPTASLTSDLTGLGVNEISVVNRFQIRQDSDTKTPAIDVDEIRVGLTWASVTPKALITDVRKIESERNIPNIYPNPVRENINIDNRSYGIEFMEIYNITGKKVLTQKMNGDIDKVDLSNLPAGIYIVNLKGEGVSFTRKFVKK